MFLADKLDPHKVNRYPYLAEFKTLAEKNLDVALLKFLDRQLTWLIEQGSLIHPASIEARNDLLTKLRLT